MLNSKNRETLAPIHGMCGRSNFTQKKGTNHEQFKQERIPRE